ncbi:glycosyltransferase family 1 protein [Pseudoflavonifractor sp. 524-17]|uniref:glycosyltransferase family 4 protein n=1 Tax=Pseudoflavonifractor sp. 524-17 TaxID=2304577 RepID=UPI00137AC783|nr:glycosyltransferase family 4 protein [Pseudoflavonifractor sp. 524-17]NCE65446.1 glycosyltransferase family 1 protein [Pseudoflavonifractor sp. 524-17]
MIKVALISHSSAFTGAEKMLYCLGKLLAETKEYYPIIFYPQDSPYGVLPKVCEGELEIVPFSAHPWYLYVTIDNKAHFADETLRVAGELSQRLREQGVGLVVCNTMTSLAPMLAARQAGIPAILWVHGILDSFYISADYDPARRLLYDRLLMAMSDQVVCCSKWTENYYRGLTDTPVLTVTNWTEAPKDDSILQGVGPFVCLNTFDAHKGIMVLLKAAKRLKEKKIVFHIDLYGTGSEENTLRNFVAEHDLEETVVFRGRTSDVDSVYRESFTLVQPCDLEPFGLTITEAMSHGRPVIAMNSGGPSEIVLDGKTGFLLEPRDDEALAERMEFLLSHPEEAKRMGLAGQKRYEKLYSPQRAKEEFCSLFGKILGREGQSFLHEQLAEDTLREWLRQDAAELLRPNGHTGAADLPYYRPDQLCFSGALTGKRTYRVHCKDGKAKGIGLLVAGHDSVPVQGMLYIRLLQHGQTVAEGSRALEQLPHNLWSVIPLTAHEECVAGTIDVELNFDYAETSGCLGVYEWSSRRSFWYKVFNKLHCPLKGMDTVVAPILQ